MKEIFDRLIIDVVKQVVLIRFLWALGVAWILVQEIFSGTNDSAICGSY